MEKYAFYKSFKEDREYGLWTETVLIFSIKIRVNTFLNICVNSFFGIIVHNSKTSKRVNDGNYFDPTSFYILKWWILDLLCQTSLNLWLTELTLNILLLVLNVMDHSISSTFSEKSQ